MEKLIETVLPLKEINAESIREKAGKAGHPANLHMWWGRSPKASSLAALSAAILDDAEDEQEESLGLLEKVSADDLQAISEMAEKIKALPNAPTVCDPFAGFGGIPIAAQELGLNVAANDLNPVAVMLTRAATDIPAKFRDLPPVHPGAPERVSYNGAEGLAEDVRFYGDWLENQALKRLADTYPQTESGEIPFAWLWVRTVKCPNPACGCKMPLGSSFILSKAKSAEFWAEPIVEGESIRFQIHEGTCPKERESNKIGGNGAKFRCPVCGEITTDEYIKKMGLAHELGAEMMAVVTNIGSSKRFSVPDEVQQAAAQVQPAEDVPSGTIPQNAHWFSPPGFGITEYADLFTPRQMLMLTTFSDLIHTAQDMAASAALAAGVSAEGGTLEAGGTGALAYGQAVGVYLAFVVDKMTDYNSSMCSWRTAGANIRSTFGRQAIPMIWTFAEGNPFSNVSGNFKSMLSSVAASVENLKCEVSVTVTQCDAAKAEYPQSCMICTEPPYYRDIGYADLSDFFYIWLRRSLKDTYPEMFASMVTPKEELSTVSTYYGEPKDVAERRYRAEMQQVCKKLYDCSSIEFPAMLFYCFRKNDMESIKGASSGSNESAWDFMLESLISAGFAITAIWPMRSEPASDKADSSRVLIVARKAEGRIPQTTRRGFVSALKRELPERLTRIFSGHINEDDELLSSLGQGIAIYTKFQTVLNADGSRMCVHDAMQIIYLECENYLTQRKTNVEEE